MAKAKKEKLTLEEKLEQALVPENEQPFKVPENWCWTKMGTISTLYRGVSYKKNDAHNIQGNNDCLIMRGGNIKEGQIDLFAEDNIYVDKSMISEIQFVKKDDIIIVSSTGSTKVIGRAGISDTDYSDVSFGAFLTLVRPIDTVCKKYVALYFQSDNYRNRIRELASGVNINNIRNEYITETYIPLPPLAEQQRIVDRIESLFAKLDSAKELIQNALGTFEMHKAAILHKAFTGELTAKWREENGVDFERDWQEKKLKEVCKLSSGGTPSRTIPEYYNGNIPWVKTGEIDWNYIYDSEEKITQDAVDNSSAKLFLPGTVLVAMYGQGLTRGRASILAIEATTNQAVCALIPIGELYNRFLFFYFMSNYWIFREKAVGGNQPNFSGKIIGEFVITLPPLDEQKEIVRILDNIFDKEQKAKELCDVIDKIDLMKKAILVRAFRGELGTNDPSEESAVELLKECLK